MTGQFERPLSSLHTVLQEGERNLLFHRLLPSVVRVHLPDLSLNHGGVLIDDRGYILTHGMLQEDSNATIEFECDNEVFEFSAQPAYHFKKLNMVLLDIQDKEAFYKLPKKLSVIIAEGNHQGVGFEVHSIGRNFRYINRRIHHPKWMFKDLISNVSLLNGIKSFFKTEEDFSKNRDELSNSLYYGCMGKDCFPGEPMFNNLGELLGLYAFAAQGFMFFVDLTDEVSKDEISGSIKECEESREEKRKEEGRKKNNKRKEVEQKEKGEEEREEERKGKKRNEEKETYLQVMNNEKQEGGSKNLLEGEQKQKAAKIAGEAWKKMTEKQKAHHVEIAKKNKDRRMAYKQRKEEEAVNMMKEDDELMKLRKQEDMQLPKKKKKKKKSGPERKRPSPPYILWCKDQWNEVKKENPNAEFEGDRKHLEGQVEDSECQGEEA